LGTFTVDARRRSAFGEKVWRSEMNFFLPNQDSRCIRPPRAPRIALVRLIALAILALVLCSCADSYEVLGLHLKRAADGDRDNAGHGYISGEGDPGGT
jgi:hypothetical protein